MKETWASKVKFFLRRIIKKAFGHEYGCCEKLFYPCRKCRWVTEDRES